MPDDVQKLFKQSMEAMRLESYLQGVRHTIAEFQNVLKTAYVVQSYDPTKYDVAGVILSIEVLDSKKRYFPIFSDAQDLGPDRVEGPAQKVLVEEVARRFGLDPIKAD